MSLAFACALLGLPGPALGAQTPKEKALYRDGPDNRYLLDGAWWRRADPLDEGLNQGFQRSEALARWTRTSIPNAANAGDFSKASFLGGVYWYRKDFRAPQAPPDASWILRFESVNYRATVWLNGRLLGRHAGAYLPFELEARNLLRRGVNRLVVRVDGRRRPLDVPSLAVRSDGRFVGGWWNYTGILREAYLRRVQGFDFAGVLVRPRLPCRTCPAAITVEATVRNLGPHDRLATIEGSIEGRRPPYERQIVFAPETVPSAGFSRFRAAFKLRSPRLWSPEHPNLYTVRLTLKRDDDVVQRYTLHTGVRSFEVDDAGRLLLNGRPAGLRGAGMHEDEASRGAALRPANINESMGYLRDLGATMTRSHYPLNPLTLELADRYGILVWSEIPVYQMRDKLFTNEQVRDQSLRMLREVIHRDQNHPSVLVWSIGNENAARPATGFQRYVRAATRLARRLDPTRLVGLAIAGYPTVERQAIYAQLDALGVNDYFGWYPGPQNSIAQREGLSPYLDRLHADYRRQALFVTEFGAEANRVGPVDEKGTFAFQGDFLKYHLDVIDRKRFINGALVWILRDFRVKPGYDGGNSRPQPPMNFKGLIDDFGIKKPAFETVRGMIQAKAADEEGRTSADSNGF